MNSSPPKSRRFFIALTAAAAFAVGATLWMRQSATPEATPSNQQQVKIAIGYQPTTFYTYLFLAEEAGYFREAGIQPEFVKIPSANKMFQAFLAGQLQMTGLTATETLLRGMETIPNGFVSPLMVEINGQEVSDWILVPKDSPIKAITDLAGKKIGTHPGTAVSGILKEVLEKNGVDPKNVTIQELTPDIQVDSVLSGAVDAIICLEPTGTTLIQAGCRVLMKHPFGSVTDAFPASYAALDQKFIREHPEAAEQLVAVIKKSVMRYRELIKADRPKIDRLVVEKLGVAPEIASALSPAVYRLPDEWNDESFAAAIKFYVSNGVLKAPITLDALRWKK